MYLTLVQFAYSKKKFLFSADTRYEIGDKVVCDTCNGEQVGEVVDVSTLQWSGEALKSASHSVLSMLVKTSGATLPLKKILRKKGVSRIEKINSVEELEKAHKEWDRKCYECEKELYLCAISKADCFKNFLKEEVME